jgi:hypothetical protein
MMLTRIGQDYSLCCSKAVTIISMARDCCVAIVLVKIIELRRAISVN